MSENEYVATAAAEKRLREVLADLLAFAPENMIEATAVALLDGAKIEYKARAKQVVISLDLPDVAATRKPKTADPEPVSDSGPAFSPDDTADTAGVPAPPQPHIAPFQPKQYGADDDFEDVHYD